MHYAGMSMKTWQVILVIGFYCLPPASALAGAVQIAGRPQIIDGDSLRISDKRIRLSGIDAPELKQRCLHNDKTVMCGEGAREALIDKIDGRNIHCRVTGRDRYKRYLARCLVAGKELNSWMVSQGYALAYRQYSTRYVSAEERAAADNRYLHSMRYRKPWVWRRKSR
jgi:endonuclease YncB( thermonuclease family)